MSVERALAKRSGNKCELCSAIEKLNPYTVPPYNEVTLDHSLSLCMKCSTQLDDPTKVDVNHWRFLNDAIWHELNSVKVLSWRMLEIFRSRGEGWAIDLQDMMYMDEPAEEWARHCLPKEGDIIHRDSNGVALNAGDSVVLIKDLDVKGSSLTAKRGSAVRNIRLDPDNEEYIEGKVEGQTVVIITKYVKKI